jgi:hypothetical protein
VKAFLLSFVSIWSCGHPYILLDRTKNLSASQSA